MMWLELIECFVGFLQFVRNDRHETLCQQDPDCFTVIPALFVFKHDIITMIKYFKYE